MLLETFENHEIYFTYLSYLNIGLDFKIPFQVNLETMLFIVDQCPSLRHIWGLDLLMLSPASIAAVQNHIERNNRWIDLHDGMSGSRLVLEIVSTMHQNYHKMLALRAITLIITLIDTVRRQHVPFQREYRSLVNEASTALRRQIMQAMMMGGN